MRYGWLLLALLALVGVVGVVGAAPAEEPQAVDEAGIWYDVGEAAIAETGERRIIPRQYRTVAADVAALQALLATAPQEGSATPIRFPLPLPDGRVAHFLIEEYAMMEPPLAAKFPEIRTYLGQGIEEPSATVRLDWTPAGFHAMILAPSGTVYLDPYQVGDTTHYLSYFKRDFWKAIPPELGVEGSDLEALTRAELRELNLVPSGDELRTYRLVVAATGEYTAYHGGTVGAGMAAIVTSMNRVGGIYEREVAVRFVLVANNDLVVYTNGATDPYTNTSGTAMLAQNQNNVDLVIGSANYDVGHVFSTGGGGVAFLAVVCNPTSKARGVTGSSNPVGDPFDVDYVAHELGHQFGGNHTFNGATGACSGNGNPSTAYEPGSGSTIMAYAGICGAEDLQPNSDDYFHTISFDEIVAHTTVGGGNSCAQITATGNAPPVVNAGPNYTIPSRTPFELTGSAMDANGDALTYAWEQFDLGPAAPPNTDDGFRPIFRSFDPVPSPSRIFPKLSDLLNNTSTLGESLPTTTRTLTFRLTARDNRVGGGGVDYDTAVLSVVGTAGPFLVTAPNTAVTWPHGSNQAVTWNIANTAAAPILCGIVNVMLSTDGGVTFPYTLAAATPNDGSESIIVPDLPTTTARVKVACATNVFFDLSNFNFTITGSGSTPTPTATATPTASATATPTATATGQPSTPTATATTKPGTPTATATGQPSTPTATATTKPGTPTATATGQPSTPTATATTNPGTPTATATGQPSTPTPTGTLVPPPQYHRYLPLMAK